MYVVHDTFRIKFGSARDVRALMAEGMAALEQAAQAREMRVLWNFTGPNYTFVLQTSFDSLKDFEEHLSAGMADPVWQQWYRRLVPYIEHGRREIFTVG